MAAPIYSSQPDQSCASLTAAPDLQSVIHAVSQPYTSVGTYSYPAICQPHNIHGLVAPTPRAAWNMHGLGATTTTGASANACYAYMDPVYPLHDAAHGP